MLDRVQLIKRGVAFAGDCHEKFAQHVQVSQNPEDAEKFLDGIAKRFQSPLAIIVLALTVFAGIFVLFTAEYAIRFVATNLAIIEHTETTGSIALSDEPDAPLYKVEKAPLLDDLEEDQKLPVLEQETALPIKPITSSLRSTMRHMRSQEGFTRFRGLRFGMFYAAALAVFTFFFQAVLFEFIGPLGLWLGSLAAALACCNAHATWTHATIAAPSDKKFFERFLPRQVARSLILPTIRLQATIGMMKFMVVSFGRVAIESGRNDRHQVLTAILGLLPIIAGIVMAFGMVLPSYIALIRAEASVLPEDMSAIVPFDRTFGGRFLQTTDSEDCLTQRAARRLAFVKGMTVRGAFMTFNRNTYKRTVRMLAKFVLVSVVLNVAFIGVLVTEVFIIAGGSKNVRKGLDIAHAVQRGDL